jgi:hypothetical protein
MGCGCNKKKATTYYSEKGKDASDPSLWGPYLWKYLHCLTEKIGQINNASIILDQARNIDYIIHNLPDIIPCQECQQHCKNYFIISPPPKLVDTEISQIKSSLRKWLLDFHNAVRTRKAQPITIVTEEDYIASYKNCFMPRCDYNELSEYITFAIRQKWVKIDAYKKWKSYSEKLNLLIGNLIV